MTGDEVCGLYTDADECAVFVVPVASDTGTLHFRAHGAESDTETCEDWIAYGQFDPATGVCTMKRGDTMHTGTFTGQGILWDEEQKWTKIHVLNTQFAALRRPPFLLSVFVIHLVWALVCKACRTVRGAIAKKAH